MRWQAAWMTTAAMALLAGPALAEEKAPPAKAPAVKPIKAGKRDEKVWKAVEAATPGALDLLKQLVAIDSQTGDLEGAARIHAILIPRFKALGAAVEVAKSEAPDVAADNLVFTLTGAGKVRILIIAHIDTVFPKGTTAKWSWSVNGERISGPGITDEKGGVVEALTVLEVLKGLGHKDYAKITVLIDGSEETGSPGSTQLIKKLSREHDVELNMEPGDAPDAVTVWRKGSANIRIDVHGRAAHAGVAPQNGRNAAVELLHQLLVLDKFPHSGDQETVNLTVLRAGERTNVIPDLASATINVRVRKLEDYDRITGVFQANAKTTLVPDTTVEVSRTGNFPPLGDNPGTAGLAARAQRIYGELGRPLGLAGNGGASESALASAEGAAAIDGLGPVGGDFHTDHEWMDTTTVTPRYYLVARLIIDLGKTPPMRTDGR
ncbi:MAG: glutamate carboxypeptidase [Caulobacter sp.]|nr:glutamate carboxypeptidase [Caulobacter sp.]